MQPGDAAAAAPGAGAPPALQSLNLTSYIASLRPDTRSQLYGSPWTCQAVFRALEPLAQQYALRLLYAPDPLPDGYVRNWAKTSTTAAGKHEAALRQLRALSLLASEGRSGSTAVSLHLVFRQQLRGALAGSTQGGGDVDPVALSVVPSQDAIAEYAVSQWEGVLTFLLDPVRQSPPSLPVGLRAEPLDVERLVAGAGLIEAQGRALTGAGFRFLLMDTNSQVWVLLRDYIRSAEAASAAELSSVLSFLMQLGFRQVGRPYPMAGLSPLEQRIAAHMAQLGLLRTFKSEGGTYYCPTALASTLCGGGVAAAAALSPSGLGASGSSGGGGGYVIVETNFRTYAYTSSRIQMRVLEEFCRLDCALPNLFVGTLTRDSVQRALGKGMTADDIIGFLQSHAHPQVAARMPSVPETVQDQIRLWERETQRVGSVEGFWYSAFELAVLYERSHAFAQQRGLLLWDSPEKRQMVVTTAGHAAVKEHIRWLKEQLAMGVQLNPATQGMCSQCYRQEQAARPGAQEQQLQQHPQQSQSHQEQQQQQQQQQHEGGEADVACSSSGAAGLTDAVSPPSPSPSPSAGAPSATKASTRCLQCRRKVGLLGFSCKCGGLFCGQHRHAEQHGCAYDFKGAQRARLAAANPLVQAAKLQRI
ncbi:MAG: transcription factor Tfb2-domain-containing protein [Monoraphidium minutum]|nr:MAG: transcription factor Tfb2-domain-containing protein [Monoraphidium minutum]